MDTISQHINWDRSDFPEYTNEQIDLIMIGFFYALDKAYEAERKAQREALAKVDPSVRQTCNALQGKFDEPIDDDPTHEYDMRQLRKEELKRDVVDDIAQDLRDQRDEEGDDFMTDGEADADVLASAGWGTDEDYGHFSDLE